MRWPLVLLLVLNGCRIGDLFGPSKPPAAQQVPEPCKRWVYRLRLISADGDTTYRVVYGACRPRQ